MEVVQVGGGDQLHEIVITGLVAREQREMIRRIALFIRPVLDRSGRHVTPSQPMIGLIPASFAAW